MTKRTLIVAWGLVVGAAVGTPSALEAQTTAVDRNIQRAERHEAKARKQMQNRYMYDQAAWNFRRAGNLRPEGDPQAVEAFELAGRLAYYAGDHGQSARDLERASSVALLQGDIVAAAGLLVDAAWVAAEGGMNDSARSMAERARILAEAPTFTEADRGAVLSRLVGAGIAAPGFRGEAGGEDR